MQEQRRPKAAEDLTARLIGSVNCAEIKPVLTLNHTIERVVYVAKLLINMVGLPRFELGTSCTPSKASHIATLKTKGLSDG